MSTAARGGTASSSGLGIDLFPPLQPDRNNPQAEVVENIDEPYSSHRPLARDLHQASTTLGQSTSILDKLRLSEFVDSTVEMHPDGSVTFHTGRVPVESLRLNDYDSTLQPGSRISHLSRKDTFLGSGASSSQTAAELKSILGSSTARLRPNAALFPISAQDVGQVDKVSLEQAKPRARVAVDLMLKSNTCVQGGYLQGVVKILIRKPYKLEGPVMISGGKLRAVGFECILDGAERHLFYQASSPLSSVGDSIESICITGQDADGFALAPEGLFKFAFSMLIPLSNECGIPKGVIRHCSSSSIRYIAMFSIKVKDVETGKRSVAHFYRDCEVWPRLNPAILFQPSPIPLRARESQTSKSGKVTLTATLHRLDWVAGQRCYVFVDVDNKSRKAVRGLILTLHASTVTFQPRPKLDALSSRDEADPDACQTSTTLRRVAESKLELGRPGTRGHASAEGWWTGVGPGAHTNLYFNIIIPPGELSVSRGRLLEVNYTLQVSIVTGTLSSDLYVTLPLRIVDFLSIDPPPTFQESLTQQPNRSKPSRPPTSRRERHIHSQHARPGVGSLFGSRNINLEALAEIQEEDSAIFHQQEQQAFSPPLRETRIDRENGPLHNDKDSEGEADGGFAILDDAESDDQWAEAEVTSHSIYEDDADDLVRHAISSASIDSEYGQSAPRFADLYYASIKDDLHAEGEDEDGSFQEEYREQPDGDSSSVYSATNSGPVTPPESVDVVSDMSIPPIQRRGRSSFARRVQEKQLAAGLLPRFIPQVSSPEMERTYTASEDTMQRSRSIAQETDTDTVRDLFMSSQYEDFPTTERVSGVDPSTSHVSFASIEYHVANFTEIPPTGLRTSDDVALGSGRSTHSRTLPRPPTLISKASEPEEHNNIDGKGKPVRPTIPENQGSDTSVTSVRDMIRELEERVKAVESSY